MPVDLPFTEVSAQTLLNKKSGWHDAYQQKHNGKKDKNHDQSLRGSKRQRFAIDQTRSCIFCLSVCTSEKLHAVTTTNVERNLN